MKTASQRWIVITFFLLATVGSLLFLEISKSIQHTTLFIPALNIQLETVHILILLVYTLCFIRSTSNHWYFIPLVVFVMIQLFYSAWCLVNKSHFIEFQLNACWNETKHAALYQIQSEYHCKGFFDINDRSIPVTMATEACFPVLYNAFGDTIYMWGVALFIIKVIQAIGLMFCFAIYHHHRHDAIMQVEELDEKEIEFS